MRLLSRPGEPATARFLLFFMFYLLVFGIQLVFAGDINGDDCTSASSVTTCIGAADARCGASYSQWAMLCCPSSAPICTSKEGHGYGCFLDHPATSPPAPPPTMLARDEATTEVKATLSSTGLSSTLLKSNILIDADVVDSLTAGTWTAAIITGDASLVPSECKEYWTVPLPDHSDSIVLTYVATSCSSYLGQPTAEPTSDPTTTTTTTTTAWATASTVPILTETHYTTVTTKKTDSGSMNALSVLEPALSSIIEHNKMSTASIIARDASAIVSIGGNDLVTITVQNSDTTFPVVAVTDSAAPIPSSCLEYLSTQDASGSPSVFLTYIARSCIVSTPGLTIQPTSAELSTTPSNSATPHNSLAAPPNYTTTPRVVTAMWSNSTNSVSTISHDVPPMETASLSSSMHSSITTTITSTSTTTSTMTVAKESSSLVSSVLVATLISGDSPFELTKSSCTPQTVTVTFTQPEVTITITQSSMTTPGSSTTTEWISVTPSGVFSNGTSTTFDGAFSGTSTAADGASSGTFSSASYSSIGNPTSVVAPTTPLTPANPNTPAQIPPVSTPVTTPVPSGTLNASATSDAAPAVYTGSGSAVIPNSNLLAASSFLQLGVLLILPVLRSFRHQ